MKSTSHFCIAGTSGYTHTYLFCVDRFLTTLTQINMNRLAMATLVAFASWTPTWSEVGSKAAELKPTEWLNHKGKVSWSSLTGQVILIEKWATW